MLGLKVGHYRIIDILGEGGMGIVYKALDVKLERFVAIKILNSQALTNPQFVERFKREAKNQAKLNHPNIVPVYGFTEEHNLLGIVMEYVEGVTLEHLIEVKGRINLQESLNILRQILLGAQFAHNKGFVHRDIKPSNIIVNNEGIAKIMDFGISKSLNETKGITRTGTKIGTILYMSPEQIKSLEPTNQSDIYAIGITFYEMLNGKNPFDLGSDYKIMEAHLKLNPPRLSTMVGNVGQEVDDIIARALHKSLKKRYSNCEEFLLDVNTLAAKIGTTQEHSVSAIKSIGKTFPEAKTTTSPIEKRSFFSKIKFFVFAFFFIVLFAALVIFIYDTVSDYWTADKTNNRLAEETLDGYKLNPAYTAKTKWQTISTPTKEQINSIVFTDDSTGFACGLNGTFLKSTNGGSTWSVLIDTLNELSKVNFYDIDYVHERDIILTASEGRIISYNPKDSAFREINSQTTESLFDLYLSKNSNAGFISGSAGTILKSEDGGYTWKKIKSPVQKLLYKIFFLDDNKGFIVGWDGVVLITTDGGNNWDILQQLSDKYLKGIFFVNNDVGFIAGGGGEIHRTTNGGKDWEQVNSGIISGLSHVWFFDNSHGIILGSKGEILVTSDSGKTWKITQSGQFAGLTNLAVANSNKIFLSGQNGLILTSSN